VTIKRILFARPVPLPADQAATHLVLSDDRYTSVVAEMKANGVQLTVTEKSGAVGLVYIPLANVTCIHGDVEPTKGK
jgi:hypothetical protein